MHIKYVVSLLGVLQLVAIFVFHIYVNNFWFIYVTNFKFCTNMALCNIYMFLHFYITVISILHLVALFVPDY